MPYCQRCHASRELTNITSTASPNTKQGNCVQCNYTVFFFTDVNLQAADAKPSVAPRQHDMSQARLEDLMPPKISPAEVLLNKVLDGIPAVRQWVQELPRLYLAGGLCAIALLVVLFTVFGKAPVPRDPLSGVAKVEEANLTITNNNGYAWTSLTIKLNGGYSYAASVKTLPAHGTCFFPFIQFHNFAGHPFDPASEAPKRLQVEAKDAGGHTEHLEMDVNR